MVKQPLLVPCSPTKRNWQLQLVESKLLSVRQQQPCKLQMKPANFNLLKKNSFLPCLFQKHKLLPWQPKQLSILPDPNLFTMECKKVLSQERKPKTMSEKEMKKVSSSRNRRELQIDFLLLYVKLLLKDNKQRRSYLLYRNTNQDSKYDAKSKIKKL